MYNDNQFPQSSSHPHYELESLQVMCGTVGTPTATIALRGPDGKTHSATASGNGPVDATYHAIDAIVNIAATVQDFSIHAATKGRSGLGNVWVRVENPQTNRAYGGFGSDSDIIVASAKAYLTALNNALADHANAEPMSGTVEDVGVMMVG